MIEADLRSNSRKYVLLMPRAFLHLACWTILAGILLYPLPVALTTLTDGFDSLASIWTQGWVLHAFRTNPMKLFDANIFYPAEATLALSHTWMGLLPIFAPAFWLTGSVVAAQNMTIWAGHVIMAIGIYIWVMREFNNRPVALLIAFITTFAPTRLGHFGWTQYFSTLWMPYAFMGLREMLRSNKKRWLALFVAAFTLQCLSGLYLAYIMVLTTILFVPAYIIINRTSINLRKVIYNIAIAIIILLPIFLMSFLPLIKKMFSGIVATPNIHYYMPPLILLLSTLLVWPLLFYSLIFMFKDSGQKDRAPIIFAFLALLLFLFSLGDGRTAVSWAPFNIGMKIFPGLGMLRMPKHIIYPFLVMASIPAAQALININQRIKNRSTHPGRWVAACLLCISVYYMPVFYFKCLRNVHGYLPVKTYPPIYSRLAELPDNDAVIELPFRNRDIYSETLYMFFSLAHFHPIANGYRSRLPIELQITTKLARNIPKASAIDGLRSLGIKWLVVHEDLLSWVDSPAPFPPSFFPGEGWKYDRNNMRLVSENRKNTNKIKMSFSLFRWTVGYMALQKLLISMDRGGIGEVLIDKSDAFVRNELILTFTSPGPTISPIEFRPEQKQFLLERVSPDRGSINLTFYELTNVIPVQAPGKFWQWMQVNGIKKINVLDLGIKPFEGMSREDLLETGLVQEDRIGSDVLYRIVGP